MVGTLHYVRTPTLSINAAGISEKIKIKIATHEDIIEQLADISYLLFGTEAARNPMVLINHQMILDLMIEAKYSFSYFFNWRDQNDVGVG